MKKILYLSLAVLFLSSCESKEQKLARLQQERKQRIELAKQEEYARFEREEREEAERIERAARLERERIEREAKLEQEQREKEVYEKYMNNHLQTGATPYSRFYGGNPSCNKYGCSQITVRTPHDSDVLVTIKRNNEVVRHAYIRAGSSFTFEMPNGEYQPFFYYGKGWDPEKVMKELPQGVLKGGFISDETFGKDEPQSLNNDSLEYELILQQNGNFSTRPSNAGDAL